MFHARLLAAVLAPAALLTSIATLSIGQVPAAAGQAAPAVRTAPLAPRELSNIRAEFVKVQTRTEGVQRDFDRAARNNLPAVREQALKDWQRSLEGLDPYVQQLSPAVPNELELINQYKQWRDLYNEAAGPAQAGEFFLQTAKYWTSVTAGTEGWEDENTPGTFDAMVKPDADESAQSLGMPKTLAFIKAANTYINAVVARPDFAKFKDTPNVKQDLAQAMAARARAQTKYAAAVNAALIEAGGEGKLDQNGRDKLETFVEGDMATALASFPGQPDLTARGRQLLFDYDKRTIGEAAATEKSKVRLTAAAERDWPAIVARYAAKPMTSVDAGRGQIIRINNARNLIGKQFGVDDYDFADYVGGAPVVGTYAPGVKAYLKSVYAQTNMNTLPDDTVYDIVAVLRGTAQVPNVKQRPTATTAPAGADDAAATTSPAVTNCAVIEIVALKAGPAAVGTDVVVTPER